MFTRNARYMTRLQKTKPALDTWMFNWKAFSELTKAQEVKNVNKSEKSIFEQIIDKEIKADIIYEDDKCMAFNDVAPQAPTHFLVIPKRKIAMLRDATIDDSEILGTLLYRASALAKERLPDGFRVVINDGVQGCQSVYHLHVHVIGGRQLKWPPG